VSVPGFGSLLQRENLRDRGKLPSYEPVYSKVALGDRLIFETYVSSGVVEVPEMEVPADILILRSGSPSVIEWREKGRDRMAELPPGSVSLLPAGLRDAARVFRPLPGVASILQMQPDFVQRAVGEIAKSGKVELVQRRVLKDAQIARLMESLRADVVAGSTSGRLFGESIAVALSAYVAQKYGTITTKLETFRGGLARSRLNRVVEYIHAHLDENLELSTLAEVAGLNVYHFARAFKQSTGESPHQYVLRIRIEHAKKLLHQPQLSVIEASARTGFVDQSHFSKVFRRMVGVAPSEYRSRV
jgi:AraC family transcriptional regulator